MQVKSIAECFIKLYIPFVIKTFVLSFFEWPFYTGLLYAQKLQTHVDICV